MKVLLIKDVYKLGRAGDIKKVADGYGRNFLVPQGMAVLATPGAMKTAERIRSKAAERRTILNEEMSVVAEALKKIQLTFGARAGETGKLYGSITSQEIADAIQQKSGYEIKRQQLDMQPLRALGEHTVRVRLTMDLIPEMKVTVYREGEAEPSLPIEEPVEQAEEKKHAKAASKKVAEVVPEKMTEVVPEKTTETGESDSPTEA
jgi:large subunit ribosomal protein L9